MVLAEDTLVQTWVIVRLCVMISVITLTVVGFISRLLRKQPGRPSFVFANERTIKPTRSREDPFLQHDMPASFDVNHHVSTLSRRRPVPANNVVETDKIVLNRFSDDKGIHLSIPTIPIIPIIPNTLTTPTTNRRFDVNILTQIWPVPPAVFQHI
jgi:hypothetical protein